ncbi:MAG: glycosyltransferase family 4 protein [Candidatus Hydrothermarchaeota archaeon]
MKVLLVANEPFYPPTGGCSIGTWEIARRIAEEYELHVVSPQHWDGEIPANIEMHPYNPKLFKVHRNMSFKTTKYSIYSALLTKKVKEVISKVHPDLILSRNAIALLSCGLVKGHIPLLLSMTDIITAYNQRFALVNPVLNRIEVEIVKMADGIMTITNAMAKELIKRGLNPSKFYPPHYDGVAVDHFDPGKYNDVEVKDKYNIESPIVGSIGSITRNQGLDFLVDAGKFIDEDVNFLIVGEGDFLPFLKKKIEKTGQRKRFTLTGFVPFNEIPKYHIAIDIGVATYRETPSSRVSTTIRVLEYWSMGKPVVAHDFPGIREIFDKSLGELCKPENPRDLAEKINVLLGRKDDFSKKCRNYVKEKFTWDACTERIKRGIEDLYNK